MLFLSGNTLVLRSPSGMRRLSQQMNYADTINYVREYNQRHLARIEYLFNLFDQYSADQILQLEDQLVNNIINHLPDQEDGLVPGLDLSESQIVEWQHQQLLTSYNNYHQTGYQLSDL